MNLLVEGIIVSYLSKHGGPEERPPRPIGLRNLAIALVLLVVSFRLFKPIVSAGWLGLLIGLVMFGTAVSAVWLAAIDVLFKDACDNWWRKRLGQWLG